MHFLIVDDSKISITIIEKHLDNVVVDQVHHAENGEQALEIYKGLREKNVEDLLIFMDINLPKMNGIETIKKIREIEKLEKVEMNARAKILVVTAYDTASAEHLSLVVGANGYIRKPLLKDNLLEAINSINLELQFKD